MSATRSKSAKKPRYIDRPNPYAASIARTGIRIRRLHPPKSKPKELRPPSNRFAAGIQAAGVTLRVGPGRPEAGREVGPSSTRSVRLPARVWKAIERAAARQRVTVHALLRAAIARVVES
jgi:hypothetical protein